MNRTHNLIAMNTVLSSLFKGGTNQNTTLMELNSTQFNRLKGNCIIVSDLRINSEFNHIYYDNVKMGNKVSHTKESKKFGTSKKNEWLNVHKTKSRLVLIIAPKVEYLKHFPDAHVFGTVLTYNNTKTNQSTPPMSGYVILMMSSLSNRKLNGTFTNQTYDIASRTKPNSLKSFEHHGTKGFNYSFGNKPLYGCVDGSSVSTYTTKKHRNKTKQECIIQEASYVHERCANQVVEGIRSLSVIIPELKNMLCPIINAAYDMQCKQPIDLLKNEVTSDVGCWNTFLFVEGRTDNFHCEDDCAYTFITVPQQQRRLYFHPQHEPCFLFKINETQTLTLPLHNDLSFIYNASFLTHRQRYEPVANKEENMFFNISSYANAKLFNHLRKSFVPMNKN